MPRGCAPFGQHQELRPPGGFNTGSLWSTDFPSLCACSESSLTNLIGWEYELNSLRMLRKSDPPRGHDSGCWPKGGQPLGTRMETCHAWLLYRVLPNKHPVLSSTFAFSVTRLKWYYDKNRIFPIAAILKHKQVACMKRKMLFTIFKYLFSFQRYWSC